MTSVLVSATLNQIWKTPLRLEGIRVKRAEGRKEVKSWASLEEAAQWARGSVLSVRRERREWRRQGAVGDWRRGEAGGEAWWKLVCMKSPLSHFTSKRGLAIQSKEAICISMGSSWPCLSSSSSTHHLPHLAYPPKLLCQPPSALPSHPHLSPPLTQRNIFIHSHEAFIL